ncbi:MAG: hypothetical protein VX265_02595 [Myxococcota bacterium]|nr:hypothetical protein [Myxococcota bacterium]MEC8423952.1 hypothetical protein [Myxococcota bacterium]
MPRPSHRLDLAVVPADPDRPVPASAAQELVDAWTMFPPAGARAVRVDLPGEVTLYANQLGGFRVRCPASGGNLVGEFGRAMTAWRRGGRRALACPCCGSEHALASLDFAPPAAFARGGVVLADVDVSTLGEAARREAEVLLGGPVRVIGRRVS